MYIGKYTIPPIFHVDPCIFFASRKPGDAFRKMGKRVTARLTVKFGNPKVAETIGRGSFADGYKWRYVGSTPPPRMPVTTRMTLHF